MKAYYFHGITFGRKSRKAELFNFYFKEYFIRFHELPYDLENPIEYNIQSIVSKAKKYIEETSKSNERIILIGSSFGCFIINRLIINLENVKIFKIVFLAPVFDLEQLSSIKKEKVNRTTLKYKLFLREGEVIIIDDYHISSNYILEEKPLLIIHGDKDELIDYKFSENYKDKIEEDKINSDTTLLKVKSNHRLTENFDKILLNIDNFLFGYSKFRMLTFMQGNELAKLWEEKILDILKKSYGRSYFGDDYHRQKIQRRNARCFLVFDNKRRLIACSYMCNDGKHIAMGVLPYFRQKGIATNLFNFSFQIIKHQYAEVENYPMYSVLKKVGFKDVINIVEIERILGKEKFQLIENYYIQNKKLYYQRRSSISNKVYKFKLLIKN